MIIINHFRNIDKAYSEKPAEFRKEFLRIFPARIFPRPPRMLRGAGPLRRFGGLSVPAAGARAGAGHQALHLFPRQFTVLPRLQHAQLYGAHGHPLQAGYLQLELEAVADNVPALTLYKSVGFQEYGRNPRGFRTRDGRWQELVLMRLELDT